MPNYKMREKTKAYFKNRFELKYALDLATYYRMLKDIKVLFKEDLHGDKDGRYQVISLYYDSPNLRAFWEKIDGEEERVKVRLRTYLKKDKAGFYGRKQSQVFLEIKKKHNQNVFKKRIILTKEEADLLVKRFCLSESFINNHVKKDGEALREIEFLRGSLQLQPKLVVSYTRQAFIARDNLNVRVTFDTDIKYRERNFSLRTGNLDKWGLPRNLVIMEIKYTDYMPLWLIQILHKYNCELKTFSKYCNGMENLFCEKPILGEINGMVY